MTTKELVFRKLKAFQDERKRIDEEYEERVNELKKHAGSEYFIQESKKNKEKKEKALETLKTKSKKELETIYLDMEKKIDGKATKAPTPEQIAILDVLRKKKSITIDELESAQNALLDNELALSALDDIAKEQGFKENFKSNAPTKKNLKETLIGLKNGVADFLEHDTTKASRIAIKHAMDLYGLQQEPCKRKIFENEKDCFEEMKAGSFYTGTQFENLLNICDGVQND